MPFSFAADDLCLGRRKRQISPRAKPTCEVFRRANLFRCCVALPGWVHGGFENSALASGLPGGCDETRDHWLPQPLQFTVTARKVTYVGNLNVDFCVGMATPYRGGILGSKTTLRAESVRDVTLGSEESGVLVSLPIEESFWPDSRCIRRTNGEPPNWGNCSDEIRRGVPWCT